MNRMILPYLLNLKTRRATEGAKTKHWMDHSAQIGRMSQASIGNHQMKVLAITAIAEIQQHQLATPNNMIFGVSTRLEEASSKSSVGHCL
jgi:hypothetical protein